jgi:hypothetical protein
MDAFHNSIKRQLDDYVGDENPTEMVAKTTDPKKKKAVTASA